VVSEVVAALQDVMDRGMAVTIYNAPYDLTLLNREAIRHGLAPLHSPSPIVDPLIIDKFVDRYRKGKRTLEAAALFYGVELLDAHDAGADAIAAGRVAQAIARRYAPQLGADVTELHSLQIGWSVDQSMNFQEYMRRTQPDFIASGQWPVR
jgi:DNA polymerase-3 subunit epsilon